MHPRIRPKFAYAHDGVHAGKHFPHPFVFVLCFSSFFSGNIFPSLHVCAAFIGLGHLSMHMPPIGDIGNAFIYIPRIWSSPQHNSHPLGIGDPQSRPFISEKGPILRETSLGKVDGKPLEWEEAFTAPVHKGLFPEQSHPPLGARLDLI